MTLSEEFLSKKKKNKKLSEEFLENNNKIDPFLKDDEDDNNKEEKISKKIDKDTSSWFKRSSAFDDGYQFGDITKTIGATAGDAGTNIVKGIVGLGEGIGDTIQYGVADIVGLFGKEDKANQIRENAKLNSVDTVFEPLINNIDDNSVFGQKSDSIAQGLGYVAGITAVSILSGGIGAAAGASSTAASTIGTTATTFTSAMGNGITEALKDGADINEARIYGAISGAGESLSELMFGGLGKASGALGISKGVGQLDDIIVGGLTKKIKNKMVKTITQSGLKAGGEGLEEVVSGLITAAGKKLTYMDEKEYSEIVKDENLAEQFWMGALTSAIAQGPSTIKSVNSGTDYITGRTSNEQKVYNSLLETKTNELKVRTAINDTIENNKSVLEKVYGRKLTSEELNRIKETVNDTYNAGKMNTDNIKLSNKQISEIEKTIDKDFEDGNISIETIRDILGENQDISKDTFLIRSMNENEQKYNSYKVEQTDNEKINILMQSAADSGMNNTTKTRKKVELISKLVQDTDRQYKFVSPEQLKEMGYNENANGLINKSTGEILINAHSEKGLQSIVGHETTHIFDSKDKKGKYSKEYQVLQDAAIEYAKTKGIYESKVQNITNTYGDLLADETQIKEELTADLVGDFLFNDEKFIENLAVKDRNVFQKIYDYIKHIYKMATAGTEEAKSLENLKYQFDKIYKTVSAETNSDIKYSIAGKKSLKSMTNEQLRKTGEESYKEAKKMLKEGKNNKEIFKKTGWFKDKVTGKMKYNFSDKNMELIEHDYKVGQEYTLAEILKHKTLFEIYPQLRNYKVKIENLSDNKINGRFNTLTNELQLDINRLKDKTNAEGTLIHEIQHAIQKIEGFANGTSTKFGKENYSKSPGEIEAKDTSTRMKIEKKYGKDLSNILPKSANIDVNPIEKMKIGLYNYITNIINEEIVDENVEINQEKAESNQTKDNRYVLGSVNNLNNNYFDNKNNGEKVAYEENLENSEKSSFSFDNQGRALSEKQHKYFKDSKVRDEKGNLIKVYHGTNRAGFTEFKRDINFFTNNKDVAQTYTGNNGMYEGYINITNPITIEANGETWSKIDVDNITIQGINDLINFLNTYGASTWKESGKLRTSTADLVSAIREAVDEGEIVSDGVIIKNIYDEGMYGDGTVGKKLGDDYITFKSNQFKNVDNTNPTDNPDIRLSMTNDPYITDNDIAVKDMLKQKKENATEEVIETSENNSNLENETNKKITRKEVRAQLLQKMNIKESDISVGEDISAINFQITDPVRVNEKVFGRKIGTKINEVTINQTKHNTAEKIRWQNKERKEIAALGIKPRSKESAAVQKYGEKKYVDEFGEAHTYGDNELISEFHNSKTRAKIKHAAQVLRNKYDIYIDSANKILTRLGYDEIPKRTDYMRHFQELTDKFSQIGIPLNLNDLKAEDLPTDINGLTEFNKPGKSWFASAMKRTGQKTTYDAITGIDGYIEGIGNTIFHTEDVQNYRALSSLIRDTYGQTHGLDNSENMTEEEISKRLEDIQNNKLSKYVAWLDEQANSLTGKKGAIDRGFERALGRRMYTVLNTAKKQVGSNMTGFNIRSSLTNLVSSVMAASKTNKLAFAKGTISTINNMLKNDDFIQKSDFLTSRFGSDLLSQKFWQKASNAGQIFMSGTDWFTSNQIVRSKYYEGLSKNMTENEAIKYADNFASRVMGDRSQGATAELFNSKTLGLFTQFQLEVNNQWQFMIHDTKMDYQQNSETNSGLQAGATAIFQMGQLAAYSYFFNELFENLTGSRATFDPIEIIKTLFGYDDDDNEKTFDKRLSEAGKILVDNIPFANLFTDGGRIPVAEAFTGLSTLGKKITGGTDEYGNELTWDDVKTDVIETIPYWVMPTGYSQAKKTIKGLSMYSNDVSGSYTDNGDLRYTVENGVGSKVQAAIFGAYANPYAQDYIDSGFKTIKQENIEEMVGLNMNSIQYRGFKNDLSKASDTSDENGYKQYVDDNDNVYWYDSENKTMYDSNYEKTTLTEEDLTKVSKTEEALNYINSLDLTDAQKSIAANNLNKNSKKKIDMSEYKNYSSYDEYKYARDNPEKYSVVSQITNYDDFIDYKETISDIKEQYSTELGYETKQRKAAVQNYINSLDLDVYQKMMLEKMAGGYSIKNYKNHIYQYLESADLTNSEKYIIWEELFN